MYKLFIFTIIYIYNLYVAIYIATVIIILFLLYIINVYMYNDWIIIIYI